MNEENKAIKDISIWYAEESAKIVAAHGQPNRSEESKRLHKNLKQAKSRKLAAVREKQTLEEMKDQLSINGKASLKWSIEDLAPYERIEQLILMKKFSNMVLTNGDIAKSLQEEQVSQQQVTALLERSDVRDLLTRLFSNNIGQGIEIYLMKGIANQDPKTVELAMKYGYGPKGTANGTSDQQHSKAIEDPEAEKMLRELGDKLADKLQEERTRKGVLPEVRHGSAI